LPFGEGKEGKKKHQKKVVPGGREKAARAIYLAILV